MRRRAALTAILVIVSSGAAWAHDGHVHKIRGVVMARDAKHVEVKTPSGEVLSIAITNKTSVVRSKRKVTIGEVEVGRRVVVGIGNGEDPLIAGEIQVGVMDAAARQTN
jgi:hypothetical protein